MIGSETVVLPRTNGISITPELVRDANLLLRNFHPAVRVSAGPLGDSATGSSSKPLVLRQGTGLGAGKLGLSIFPQ